MPMEYIVQNLKIAALIDLADEETVNERLVNLVKLEEDRFIVGLHQQVQKHREKLGMIGILRVNQLRLETLFSFMTTSLQSSQESFTCIG